MRSFAAKAKAKAKAQAQAKAQATKRIAGSLEWYDGRSNSKVATVRPKYYLSQSPIGELPPAASNVGQTSRRAMRDAADDGQGIMSPRT